MTQNQVRKLKIGDRVRYADDGCEGVVIEVGYCAIKIKWDDGAFANGFFEEAADWLKATEKLGQPLESE